MNEKSNQPRRRWASDRKGARTLPTLARKLRSGLTVAAREVGNWSRIQTLRALLPDVEIGADAHVSRGVRFRVSDGGRIRIGAGAFIEEGVMLQSSGELLIGANSFVGRGCEIVALRSVDIGADVLIAARCVVMDTNHRHESVSVPIRLQGQDIASVRIGHDVWLGSHVVVTAGSTIGAGCVVGANAVVKGVLPPFSIAVGIPARVVGDRRECPNP